jgi:type II secretory pathway pseudopilin PulG
MSVSERARRIQLTRSAGSGGPGQGRRQRGEEGISLIEVMVSVAGLAVIATMLISVFVGVTRVNTSHDADDRALLTLREVRQRITRDVREARGFLVANPATMTLWSDDDWDGVRDTGEMVTWTLGTDGVLTRSTNGGISVAVVEGLDPARSGFTYDASTVLNIRSATVSLVSTVDTAGGGDRALQFEVSLRNMP